MNSTIRALQECMPVFTENIKTNKMRYVNLYCCFGSNSFVTGKNKYETEDRAKENKNCPAGYVWVGVAEVRSW